ncbi:PIG-X [Mycena galericulata]|nr:PIG-X [Mycena galericulata]
MSNSTQTSLLRQPNSFHPSIQTTIEIQTDLYVCSLHLYQPLPPLIFVDPYELANYQDSYTFRHVGHSNLELPLAAIHQSESSILLNIPLPLGGAPIRVELPLHVRYGAASAVRYQVTELEMPFIFLSCPNSIPDQDFVSLPPEFKDSFDLSFSRILPVRPLRQSVETIRTPAGVHEDLVHVEIWTAAIFVLSFLYLVHMIQQTSRRISPPLKKRD